MRKLLRLTLTAFLILFLTITTQIGGIVLILSLAISLRVKKEFRYKKTLIFTGLYLIFTLVIIPIIAPMFGREKVKHRSNLYPATYATVLLNRNYVKPALNKLLSNASKSVENKNIEMRYLDANFPFLDGFPLIPHLSHDDGQKIDISFVYTEPGKSIDSKRKKSLSGYGVFEGPSPKEYDQIKKCKASGYWQYDYSKYFQFGRINSELTFSIPLNKSMINSILNEKNLGKLFIEPHLKSRLGLKNAKVRFHGCRAVRHDDHIHMEL